MKAIVRRAVWQAFRALKDYVEQGTVQLQNTAGFDWAAGEPETSPSNLPVEVVLVDEKLKARDGSAKRYAIIKMDRNVDHFAVLTVSGRRYRCGDPMTSYRFVTLVEVHEIR